MSYTAHIETYRNHIEIQLRAEADRFRFAIATTGDLLLNEHEVAQRQNRSMRTLQNQRVHGGGIPYFKLGRAVRYRLSDVVAWEEARRFNSTSEEGQRDA